MSNDLDVLQRQVHELRRQLREQHELLDTVFCSPLHKRIWWLITGYRWLRIGRWIGDEHHLLND